LNHSLLAVARITRHGGQATDKTDEEMIHEELSGKIIGAAMDVLNELRPGLDDPAAAGLRTRNDHRIEAPWPQSPLTSDVSF
jgi:hypothetical protein